MPWLLNEDAALKKKLQGLKVMDANAPTGRPVAVRYRLPETEIGTQTFPLIVINRTDLTVMHEREHRGKAVLLYTPEEVGAWNPDSENFNTSPYVVQYPLPYDLVYQITVLARKESHIISLAAQLGQPDRLDARFAYLEVPQDGTVRSLFVDAGPEFVVSKDGDDKRLFQANYVVRTPTELLPSIADRILVESVRFSDISITVPTL